MSEDTLLHGKGIHFCLGKGNALFHGGGTYVSKMSKKDTLFHGRGHNFSWDGEYIVP